VDIIKGDTMKERKPIDFRLLANPFTYSDLVQYQDGSIVSRTIIDKEEGTITVFAFDSDQRLSTHSASFDALVEIVDGKAVINIEGKDFHLSKGEQIIMPANKAHSIRAEERFKMVLIMIRSIQSES
jgi:quercetin dioxygenase-like cupin family protein